jgi:hypothetical protein
MWRMRMLLLAVSILLVLSSCLLRNDEKAEPA